METTAQDALKAFEDGWVTLQWTVMTDAQRNTYLRQYLGLQIAAKKESEANRVEAENQALADEATKKQQAITFLKNHGFACDNGEADWNRLYNLPKYFGSNWKTTADYQRSISTGLDYFISKAYEVWHIIQNNY